MLTKFDSLSMKKNIPDLFTDNSCILTRVNSFADVERISRDSTRSPLVPGGRLNDRFHRTTLRRDHSATPPIPIPNRKISSTSMASIPVSNSLEVLRDIGGTNSSPNSAKPSSTVEHTLIDVGTLDDIVASIPTNPIVIQILLHTYRTFTDLQHLMDTLNTRMIFIITNEHDSIDQKIQKIKFFKSFLLNWLDPPHVEDFNNPPEFTSIQVMIQFVQEWSNLQNQFQPCSMSFPTKRSIDQFSSSNEQVHSDPPLPNRSPLLFDKQKVNVQFWDSVFRKIESVMSKFSIENKNFKEVPVDVSPADVNVNDLQCLPALPPRTSDPLQLEKFSAKIIAEQLTIIDKNIFSKFIPHHCLERVRNKPWPSPVNLHDAHNRLSQVVEYTLHCASLLPNPINIQTVVIYKWIIVVKELRALKNYNSLLAVAHSIEVSREKYPLVFKRLASGRSFRATQPLLEDIQKLSDPSGNYENLRALQKEEGSGKVGTSRKRNISSNWVLNTSREEEESSTQMYGAVPFLPPFLYELTLVDNARTDSTKEGLINFRKHFQQFMLLYEIGRFQSSTKYYDSLEVDKDFLLWYDNLMLNSRHDQTDSKREAPGKETTIEKLPPTTPRQQSPESVIMKVKLVDGESGSTAVTYKSIKVSPDDRVPAIIKRCLDKFHLPTSDHSQYLLVQKLANRDVTLPTLQNAYYAIAKDDPDNIFCELRRTTPLERNPIMHSMRISATRLSPRSSPHQKPAGHQRYHSQGGMFFQNEANQ